MTPSSCSGETLPVNLPFSALTLDSGGLHLLRGKGDVLGLLGHRILAFHLLSHAHQSDTGAILCGDNVFYPTVLIREARSRGKAPEEILSRTFIARAFTIHQFHALAAAQGDRTLRKGRRSFLLLSGIPVLFSDGAVAERTASDLLERTMQLVRKISRAEDLPCLILAEEGGTNDDRRLHRVLSILNSWADDTIAVSFSHPPPPQERRRKAAPLFSKEQA